MRATATTAVLILALVFCQPALALPTTITPTTTLSAETANNTSAASTFRAQPNGNIAPTNVSKMSMRSLLYPGATTKVYAHFMGWFGPANHMNVGYSSADPSQVQRQVDDQISRGIDGVIIDWYGPKHYPDDTTTQLIMSYAQTLAGTPYKFAVMVDVGAVSGCANTWGCDLNQTLVNQLTYINNNYEGSPAYMRLNGRPAVFFFGLEKYAIDWNYVKANTPGNPAFIFENTGGFTSTASAGGFAWVQINTNNANDWEQSYLDDFYATGLRFPAQHTFAATYIGFNDTLASWGSSRSMNQNCGQTWLSTWNEINKYYSSSRQLEAVQIPTWNDYEEGSQIETGIENCAAISASLTDDTLNWSVSGNENTIDHYTVFASLDGQNLMPVADAATGIHSFNLEALELGAGTYTFYVKAVAKASMTNKMSKPVSYAVVDPVPNVVLTVTPTSGVAPVTVTASTAGSSCASAAIVSSVIDFGDGIKVSGTTVSHAYTAAGTYTITATVTDAKNVSATSTTTVTVAANKPPVASLSVSPASGTVPVVVTASLAASIDPDGRITSSRLDFGDGTVVNANTATHTYAVPGTYIISGTVTDNGGLNSTASATVSALAAPGSVTVAAPLAGGTVRSPVPISATATANTGNYITAMRVYVDNNDAYTVGAASVNVSVPMTAGAHYLVVQAWDNKGLVYRTALNVTVANTAPALALSVTPTTVTTGTAVSVSMAGTTDADGSVASYSINYGDGTVASSMTGSHAYRTAGTYVVTATATDNLGASTSKSQTVTVTAPTPVGGVTIVAPANGATVVNAVHFIATAASQYRITAMSLYVDDTLKYTVGTARLDAYTNLSAGSHYVVIQAWDATGAVYKSAMNINVQAYPGKGYTN